MTMIFNDSKKNTQTRMAVLEDSQGVVVIKVAVLVLFIIVSVIGNGSVLYAITHTKKLQTTSNYFVFNLALADILFALTGMPFIVVTNITGEWIFGHIMCNICGLFNFLFCSVSIWTLVAISVYRYLAVAKPFYFKQLNTYYQSRTYFIIVGVWLLCLLITTPPLFGWSEFTPGSNTCLLNGMKDKSYSIFLAAVDFALPFVLLSVLYFRVFLLLRKQQVVIVKRSQQFEQSNSNIQLHENQLSTAISKRSLSVGSEKTLNDPKNSVPTANSPFATTSLANYNSCQSLSSIQSRNIDGNITKMLVVVVSAFFLCWLPFVTAAALYAFRIQPDRFRIMTFGIVVACLNSVINPFIYAIMNRQFRTAFKSIYLKCQRTRPSIARHKTEEASDPGIAIYLD